MASDSPAPSCPDDDALLRFVDGEGDRRLGDHVRGCSRCQRAVALFLRSSTGDSGEITDDGVIAWIERAQAQQAASLAAGSQVERYQILRRVGVGGMGVVYAAQDPELDRPVAIKVMHPRASAAGDENRRLLREARALAKVSHPNVVAVYDVGTVDDRVFLAMELVAGMTLREWLSSPARSRGQILDVFVDAARGLAAAHAAGLVHRDFKPDNVLIGDDGRVRVTDFGLARAPNTSEPGITVSAAIVGTPSYMAPEVLSGDAADARSDQFSFGVALYRALAGHEPRPDLPLAGDGAAMPRRLRKVVERALRLDREARFASMDALVAELERCRGAGSTPRLVALALALIALLALGLWAAIRPTPSAAPAASDSAPPEPTIGTTRPAAALPRASSASPPSAPASSPPPQARPPPRPPATADPPPPPDPLSEF